MLWAMSYQTNSVWLVKAGILTLAVAGAGAKNATNPVLAASAPEAKATSPEYLSPLLC